MMADFEHRGGQVLPAVGHIVFGRPFRVARKQESRLPIRDPDDERKIVHIVVNAQRREEFDLRAAERKTLPRLRHSDFELFVIRRALHRLKRFGFKFIHGRIQLFNLAGADYIRQTADMIRMRMRADHEVNLGDMQRVLQILDHLCPVFSRSAVDDKRLSVADNDRSVALPDIHKMHGKPDSRGLPGAVRCKARRRKKRQRQPYGQQCAPVGTLPVLFEFHFFQKTFPDDGFQLIMSRRILQARESL